MNTPKWSVQRKALVLAVVGGLLLPFTVSAQTNTQSGSSSARERALEQRVDQLQQELEQLKTEIQAQHAATEQATAQAAQASAAAQKVAQTQTAAAPAAPVFSTAPGIKVALHGFINATVFHQDRSFIFGNGQNAEYPVPGPSGSLSGGDVRNTRFWLDFSGARLADGWTGGGRIEMDFFGGFNGAGAFSQQQAIPRLRQAYLALDHPSSGTQIRVGQQWEFMFPLDNVPESLAHVAFPLGFATGMVGWRFPGVAVMQALNPGTTGVKWRLDLGAFEGSWSGPGNNVNFLTAGNAGFKPQLEARLRAQGQDWVAYAVAHYSRIDLRGVGGTAPTPIKSSFDSTGFELGGKWTPGPWVLMATGYTGRGLGELFGALVQFGDIKETGGYVQVGDHLTPNWAAYLTWAASTPDKRDVIRWMGNGATGLLRNQQTAFSLEYTAGAYEFGVELLHDKLHSTSDGVNRKTTSGNQLSLSATYHF